MEHVAHTCTGEYLTFDELTQLSAELGCPTSEGRKQEAGAGKNTKAQQSPFELIPVKLIFLKSNLHYIFSGNIVIPLMAIITVLDPIFVVSNYIYMLPCV